MTTISREAARGLRVLQLLRENLELILTILIAGGERDLAGRLASQLGTTVNRELGSDGSAQAQARAQGIQLQLRLGAEALRAQIRTELGKPAASELSAEDLAEYLARPPRTGGRG